MLSRQHTTFGAAETKSEIAIMNFELGYRSVKLETYRYNFCNPPQNTSQLGNIDVVILYAKNSG